MFLKTYPDIPELNSYQGFVREDIDQYIHWNDPFELFYYYVSGYVMRYVNNYYNYEVYSPQLFQKNVFKAIDVFCNTEKNQCINMCRQECISISNMTEDYSIRTFYDDEECDIEIYYVWKSTPGCCEKCETLDGSELRQIDDIHTHWNCKCEIEQHTQYVNNNDEILYEKIDVL